MKKFIFAIIFTLSALVVSAQYTTPRFGTDKYHDKTSRLLTNAYLTPAYAASYVLVTSDYQTTVKFGQLTGNLSITAALTSCYATDRLTFIFTSDASGRVVTFSTGFVTTSSPLVINASTTKVVDFVFNGVAWVESGISGFASTKTASAINSTATATAAQVATGLITTTSAAATTITLPTATLLAAQLGASQGTIFDFVVDNSAGANVVTIAVGSGITASTFPVTNTLTLTNSTTTGTATFRLAFISSTVATLTRIN